jgi:serine/threonine protein kinase
MSGTQGAAPLPGGTVVEGYVIERVAEQGRYSVSYIAREGTKTVLLREFLPQAYMVREDTMAQPREAEDRNALRWWMRGFIDQAQTLIKVRHPALPGVQRVFEANGTAYTVSDPVAGETLEAILRREGFIDEARLRRLLQPLLVGLERAHAAGLLHRDIRPQNVVVRPDGGAVLVDFAVLRGAVRLKTGLLSGAGMAPYAAPEELVANGTYTPCTDIYALGALAYRAISGIEPPSAQQRRDGAVLLPAAQATNVRASAALVQAIDWALMLSPAARPPDLAAWRAALQAESVAVETALAAPVPRSGGRGLAWVLPVLLVALAGAGYWLFSRAASTNGATPSMPVAATAAPANSVASPPPSTEAAAPSAAPTQSPDTKSSSLDQLALDLMSKDRKAQDAARDKQLQEQRDKDERDRKAREAAEKSAKPAEADSASDRTAARPADRSSRASAASSATTSAEDAAAAARTRQLEEEIARLKAEKEQQPSQESDASRAAREKAAHDAEVAAQAFRDQQALVIAKARKTCRIPAPSLSAAGNLTFETAMRVPGAERTGAGAVRLPPVTTADGETRQFEITSDSCAKLVN